MKIEVVDKQSTRVIQQAFLKALETAAAELGVTVKAQGGTMMSGSVVLKYKVTGNSPTAIANAETMQRHHLELLGFPPETLGKSFTSRGTEYRVVGVELGRPKYPIRGARVPDGKIFLFTTEAIARVKA